MFVRFEIMASCWRTNPAHRPNFLQVVSRLESYRESTRAVANPVYINSRFFDQNHTPSHSKNVPTTYSKNVPTTYSKNAPTVYDQNIPTACNQKMPIPPSELTQTYSVTYSRSFIPETPPPVQPVINSAERFNESAMSSEITMSPLKSDYSSSYDEVYLTRQGMQTFVRTVSKISILFEPFFTIFFQVLSN